MALNSGFMRLNILWPFIEAIEHLLQVTDVKFHL